MSLVAQWRSIEGGLPAGWGDARLALIPADPSRYDRAAALLGPLAPGRSGRQIRFFCARRGAGPSPDSVRRALARLDAERIEGTLELLATSEPEVQRPTARTTLAASWAAELAALPPDWTDLYCEVELTSSDYLERAALLCAPINPARYSGRPGFRFRCGRRAGYGAAPEMVRRCLERCDEDGMTGTVHVLRVLCDTQHVYTQGPVWYVGGKAV